MKTLNEKYCHDAGKENCISDHEIGRILNKVFPTTQRRKERLERGGKRTYVYFGIKEKSASCSPSQIKFNDLYNYVPKYGFHRGVSNDFFCEWISTTRQLWNGQRVIKEIKVHNDLRIEARIAGFPVSLTSLGLTDTVLNTSFLERIFSMADVCRGFKVTTRSDSFDIHGKTQGRAGEWSTIDDNTQELRHKALNCQGIITLGSKCSQCKSCWEIRNNCGERLKVTTTEPSKIKTSEPNRKRKSYMGKEELLQELNRERKRRQNAERREHYLRQKIQREMVTFVKEDHEEFVQIFKNVQEGDVPEEMTLLWNEQAKALSTSATGRRWHPKYVSAFYCFCHELYKCRSLHKKCYHRCRKEF